MHRPPGSGSPDERRRRDRLEVAIILNQLATPGLGSWIAGHRVAGAGQLVLSTAGFMLFVVFLVRLLIEQWRAIELGIELAPPPTASWQGALALFGAAWLWSGFTSLQLWREIKRRTPPRLGPTVR